jgi:hypothetical protein
MKGISLGCLGDAFGAIEAAKAILDDLNASPSLRTWQFAAPQLQNLIPNDVLVAFNRLVMPILYKRPVGSQKADPAQAVRDRIAAAHPWRFWGKCPGGVLPWRPIVVSPSQFHRPSTAAPKVKHILDARSRKAGEEPAHVTRVRDLVDPEHINFPIGPRGSMKARITTDLLVADDPAMADLFTSFDAMNFNPSRPTSPRRPVRA